MRRHNPGVGLYPMKGSSWLAKAFIWLSSRKEARSWYCGVETARVERESTHTNVLVRHNSPPRDRDCRSGRFLRGGSVMEWHPFIVGCARRSSNLVVRLACVVVGSLPATAMTSHAAVAQA